jgi:hypothetical protein
MDWSLICCWANCILNIWPSWSERPFIEGLTSNSFKYKLSIKKLSIVEEVFELILVAKLTILLRLKDYRILLG